LAAPIELIEATNIIQSHSTSNVCTFAQYGAIAALEESQDSVYQMLQAFTKRRQVILDGIMTIPHLSCPTPMGAFYVFADISQTKISSLDFCDALLDSQKVTAVPGTVFGADNCIRLSYATDLTSIEKGIDRLSQFVSSL
jgi:aspartate aminotransferase